MNIKKQVDDCDKALQIIRGSEAKRAGLLSSIVELEKYNAKLEADIEKFKSGKVSEKDEDNLRLEKDKCKGVEASRSKLKEEMVYVNTAREILNDTGIKTKIIKEVNNNISNITDNNILQRPYFPI